jgi:hypothetical protein
VLAEALALALLALPRPAGPCLLPVAADPAHLAASAGRRVRLSVGGEAEPRLTASVGRVEGLTRTAGGWEATLLLPPVGVPRIAVVAATSADGCGLAALPIDGGGDAVVRTRRRAVVTVRIGERAFGPATAGPDGVALVPVEVPPGVEAAWSGRQRIPLRLPPVVRTAVHLDRSTLAADQAGEVTVLVAAATADGRLADGPPPLLRASAGVLSPLHPAGPGAFLASWRLEPGRAGRAAVEATFPGEPSSEAGLDRPAGPVATLALATDRPSVAAGDERPLALTVRLADAAGNPASGAVQVSGDLAPLGPPAADGPGTVAVALAPPTRLEGRERGEVLVTSGPVTARTEVALQPGPAARLQVALPGEAVTADGVARVQVPVLVSDAFGNPVDDPPALVEPGRGEAAPAERVGPGRFAVPWRPPAVTAPEADELRLRAGGAEAQVVLRLRPPIGWLAVAPFAGVAWRLGGGLGLAAGVEAAHWRWLGGAEAGLAVRLSWTGFRDDQRVATAGGTAAVRGEVRELALLAGPAWRLEVGRRLGLGLTLAAGASRVTSLVSAGGGPLVPESGWAPAGALSLGGSLALGRGRLAAAASLTVVGDPGLASLDGLAPSVSLSLGYRLDAR